MGTGAQVGKVALAIEGDHGVLRQVLDELDFIGLVFLAEIGQSLLARHGEAFKRQGGLDNFFISASIFFRSSGVKTVAQSMS